MESTVGQPAFVLSDSSGTTSQYCHHQCFQYYHCHCQYRHWQYCVSISIVIAIVSIAVNRFKQANQPVRTSVLSASVLSLSVLIALSKDLSRTTSFCIVIFKLWDNQQVWTSGRGRQVGQPEEKDADYDNTDHNHQDHHGESDQDNGYDDDVDSDDETSSISQYSPPSRCSPAR